MPSPSCLPEARDAVRSAARALETTDEVVAATPLAPDEGPIDGWTLEVDVTLRAGGASPTIQQELAPRSLTIESISRQGSLRRLVCVV